MTPIGRSLRHISEIITPVRAFAALCWTVSILLLALPISNPDVFWHLSAARRILADHALPRADWLSHTMQGRPWIDFEWLCQLLWYGTLKLGGPWGLVAFKALFLGMTGLCLWKQLGLYDLGLAPRSFALLTWSIAMVPSNDLRPENISIFLFSLEFLALESYRLGIPGLQDKGAPALRRALPYLGMILLYAFWANCHPGFIFGLGLPCIYAGAEILRTRRTFLACMALAGAAGSLINPFGPGLHRFAGTTARESSHLSKYILEWHEPPISNPWFAVFWILLLATFLLILLRFIQDKKVLIEPLAAASVFACFATRHERATPYFIVIAVPVAAIHIALLNWKRFGGLGVPRAIAAVMTLIFLALFSWNLVPELSLLQNFSWRFTPHPMTPFLEQERSMLGSRKILNPWQWGGYLGYTFHPDYKVFVDGRYIFHPLLQPMKEALRSPETYLAFLDRYGIDVVLHKRTRQLFDMPIDLGSDPNLTLPRPYYLRFLPRSDWALVYWGDEGIVFVRRSAFPKDWLRPREFTVLRPDDFPAAELEVKNRIVPWSTLAMEAERFLRLNPGMPEGRIAALKAWMQGLRP